MEQETPIEYWKELYNRYESWIDSFHSCPVLRMNICDYDLLEDEDAVEEIVKKASNILKEAAPYKGR